MNITKEQIDEVRNQGVYLKNDGTLEQLRETMKKIFTKQTRVPNCGSDYYGAYFYDKGSWVAYIEPSWKTISIKSLFDEDLKVEDKKIIGYVAPYDINSSVPSGSIYVEEKIYKNESKYVVSGKRGYGSQYYLPAQIVETWEPVYEEEFKLPKINGYEGNLKNNKLTYGCAHLSKKWFNSSDNRHIKSMVLSSGVEINEEQMNQISKYLKNEK